jgi:hypothetical protein
MSNVTKVIIGGLVVIMFVILISAVMINNKVDTAYTPNNAYVEDDTVVVDLEEADDYPQLESQDAVEDVSDVLEDYEPTNIADDEVAAEYPRGSWEWLIQKENQARSKAGLATIDPTENTPYNPFSTQAETIWGSDLGNHMGTYPITNSIKYNYKKLHITGMVTVVRPDGVMVGGTFLPGINGSKNSTIDAYCYGAYSPSPDGWGSQAIAKDCQQ